MRIPQDASTTASGIFTPVAVLFLQDAVKTMIPWIMVMLAVVVCDLAAGIRKSIHLDVHISWSMAFRETMGKMVTYVAFVLMVAMIDAASEHSLNISKLGCLFICALEGGSIISNLLKPHGIDLSVHSIVKLFGRRVIGMTGEEAEEIIEKDGLEEIRRREKDRWVHKHAHQHGSNIEKQKGGNDGDKG